MKATALLKQDHGAVKKLFTEFARTTARAQKTRQRLIDTLAHELDVHARIEEELFYPALERMEDTRSLLAEAHEEHEQIKELVAEAQGMDPGDAGLPKKVRELKDAVLHHAGEEEREIFPKAEALGPDELERLGIELAERRSTLSDGALYKTVRAIKKGFRKAA